MFKKVWFSSRMLPIDKDTLVMFGVVVCILSIFYLFRELQKIKKVSAATATPIVTAQSNWTPPLVNEAKQTPVAPVTAPVAPAPPVNISSEE